MKRSISLFLCLLLALVLLPAKAALADDRTVISTIVANSNVDQLPVCGQEIQAPTFTVTQGSPVYFSTNMGHWSKKEGESWVTYNSGVFTPGTWRYYTQFRIDGSSGTTHVLAENPTVKVNGVAWTVVGTSSVGTNFSYNNARSPEYTVTDSGELLFAVPSSVKIGSCYVNEAITSFSVAQYVSGGTAPYTFSKSAESTCPSWVKVSATGEVSGTPNAPYGKTSRLVIKVTDGGGNEKEASIVVAKVAVRYEDKTKISSIVATSNIGSILVNTGTIQAPTFTVTQGSPAYMNTSMGYWQKKNGETWSKQTSGTFTPGTWRYYVQFRVDGTDGVSYTLDRTNVTVNVDGDSWTVPWDSTIDDFFSYNNAYSPEFTVTDELPISAAAVTITAPAIGARPDYDPVLPSGAHYYSDSYNTSAYKNDVCWRNITTGPSLSVDTGVFEGGYVYQVVVYLTAKDGYFFTKTASGTINGNAAEARLLNEQLELKYTFPALPSKPAVTGHPISASAPEGKTATFNVVATGATGYQWQYKKPGESAWRDVQNNGTSATYKLTVAARHDGYVYRCRVSNAAGSVTSNTAKLTVISKPVITKHPHAVTVDAGKTATFTVTASGIGMSYRWQYQKPGETAWLDVKNNGTSATYKLTTAARHNGNVYRCQVTNAAGTVTSDTAKLTVKAKPVITTQPAAVTVNEGQTATFTVAATGATGYQWQYQKPGETDWRDVKNNGTAATYKLTTAARHNGNVYRCQVSNAVGTVTSNTAKLTVKAKPVITTQPAAVTVNEGKTATFKVVATGATGYQWQYKKPGESTWRDVQSNGTSATYKLTTAARHNGYVYRCQVSNAAGTVTSGTALLTVK